MTLIEYRTKRNKAEYRLESTINNILHKFKTKREVWYGRKTNGVNCRRLIKNYGKIINKIKDVFIETNKGAVSIEEIN